LSETGYIFDSQEECLDCLADVPGCAIHHFSDLPPGPYCGQVLNPELEFGDCNDNSRTFCLGTGECGVVGGP
jgi:hypothetical protein